MKLRRSLVFLAFVLLQTQCSFGFIKTGKLFKPFFGSKNEQISTEQAILEEQVYNKAPINVEYQLSELKPAGQISVTTDKKPLVEDLTGKKQSVVDGVKNVVNSAKAGISNKISAIASKFSKSPSVTTPNTETEYLSLGPTPIWEQIKSTDGQIDKSKYYTGSQDQAFVQYQIPNRVVPFQKTYYYPVPQQQLWPNYGPTTQTSLYPNIRYQTGVNSEIQRNPYLNSLLSAGGRSPPPVKVPCDTNAAPLKGLEAYPYGQDAKNLVPVLEDVWTQYVASNEKPIPNSPYVIVDPQTVYYPQPYGTQPPIGDIVESDSSKPFRGDIPLEESASATKKDVSRPLGSYASEELKETGEDSVKKPNQEEYRLDKRTDLNPFGWLGNPPNQEETDFNIDIGTPLQKRPLDNAVPVAEIVENTTNEAKAKSLK